MTSQESQPAEPKKVVSPEDRLPPQKAKKVKPRKVEKKGPRRR